MLKMLRLCLMVFASSLAVCSCEKGSCPPTLSVDICDATCGLSHPCNTTKICCATACGGSMCVDPMTQRHFVTLEKPGECSEYPRGVWICSHTCTGDSDCPVSKAAFGYVQLLPAFPPVVVNGVSNNIRQYITIQF